MPSDYYLKCPKCGHTPPQPLATSAQCPACGIYLFKWEQAHSSRKRVECEDEEFSPAVALHGFPKALLEPLDRLNPLFFYGRCLVLVLLAIWSWSLFGYDYRTGEINTSFMHNILLPIHEAGHVLFMPFGQFMTLLGGSLFQIALPIGISIAFIVKNRDNFGASIALWWASISLIDLSPYIYDALRPRLILLGGHTGEDGPHDWVYLLSTFGQLHNAQHWGAITHALGGLLILVALTWASAVLWKQRERLGWQMHAE